ncbi:MAG: cysteine peptidase family C39 domain-containing protein [Siphonobacter sp.]
MSRKFPFYRQYDQKDCGPTCLRMISKYYGKSYDITYLRELSHLASSGTTLGGLADAAEKIGFSRNHYRRFASDRTSFLPVQENPYIEALKRGYSSLIGKL